MKYPQCAARCKYEMKMSLMLLHKANIKMDRGSDQNKEAGGTKSEGGVVLCSGFVCSMCYTRAEAVRCPPARMTPLCVSPFMSTSPYDPL